MASGPQNLHRSLKILSHNIRGINSDIKWNSLRNNIMETNCDIICIQETKKESFDDSCIRRFCNRSFDKFAFGPSIGASGGFLTIWKGSHFDAKVIDQNAFGHMISFRTKLTNQAWWLTNIYAPCTPHRREEFLSWFSSLQTNDDKLWIFLGDFNMIISPKNRNKPGGDHLRMMNFNLVISQLGLQEISLKGQAYTWSNMQRHPLLENWIGALFRRHGPSTSRSLLHFRSLEEPQITFLGWSMSKLMFPNRPYSDSKIIGSSLKISIQFSKILGVSLCSNQTQLKGSWPSLKGHAKRSKFGVSLSLI
jgi:hypothetical protein